jgi:hypothetical protein
MSGRRGDNRHWCAAIAGSTMMRMSSPDQMRIGTTEREAALTALQQHLAAGRLELDEFDERSRRAAEARTRSELAALFTDLPAPRPFLDPAPGPSWQEIRHRSAGGPLFGRAGETAVALAPFLAVVLFFLLHTWLVFLLIPIAGAVVYGNRRGRPGRRCR